jgi:hypothetical protein
MTGNIRRCRARTVDDALKKQGVDPSGNSIKSYYDFHRPTRRQDHPGPALVLHRLRSIKRVSNELGFVGGKGPNGKYDLPTDPLNDDPLATRTMWNPGYTLKLVSPRRTIASSVS